MRLLLVGIDGLEYDYVKYYHLTNLMQNKYGKYESTDEKATPYLWGSIITGLPPDKVFKVESWTVPYNKVAGFIYKYVKCLRGKGLGRHLKRKWIDRSYLNTETIFDKYNSVVIDFPAYNWKKPEWMISIVEAVNNPLKSHILYYGWTARDYCKHRCVLEKLNKNWDILAVWYYSADIVNHLYGRSPSKIQKTYRTFDRFIHEYKRYLSKPTAIVVLSDHGGKEGVHTPYGFISTNINEIELPTKITEIRGWLEKILTL